IRLFHLKAADASGHKTIARRQYLVSHDDIQATIASILVSAPSYSSGREPSRTVICFTQQADQGAQFGIIELCYLIPGYLK
ncbi:MAG: hypothetical protein AB7P69_09800, partial [Candidatus Binatia bacterium]